jgi:hypothetical protein
MRGAIPPLPNTSSWRGALPFTFKLLLGGVYPKVSGLATWSENCKWYSSLPLDAIVSRYSVSQSSEFCRHNALCYFSTSVYCCKRTFRYRLGP